MKTAKLKSTPEYERFTDALRTILRVSHSELKADIEAGKKERKRRRAKPAPAFPASAAR